MTQPDTQPAQSSAARVVVACLLLALSPLSLIGGIFLASTRESQYMVLFLMLLILSGALPLIAGLLLNDVRVKNLQRRTQEAQAWNQTPSTDLQPEKKTGKDWWLQKAPSIQMVGQSLLLPLVTLMMNPERPISIFFAYAVSILFIIFLFLQAAADRRAEEQRRNGSYTHPKAFGSTRPRLTAAPKKPLKKMAWSTPIALSFLVLLTVILYSITWMTLNFLFFLIASLALTSCLIYQATADKRREQNELRQIYLGEDS